MNNEFRKQIDGLADSLGQSTRRRSHGYWVPFAWATRALVEKGYGVTESVRAVLKRADEEASDKTVACVRVVFYKIRKQVWPSDMQDLRVDQQGPTLEESRGDGLDEFEA